MKIGLFFGTFNPIHNGHLIIAQVMCELTDLDSVWFVVSPQNPFKNRKSLAHEQDRYDMVMAATYDNYNFQASNIEFKMPKPSYTIDTLTYLSDEHPEKEFVVIMGSDNFKSISKWKNGDVLLQNYSIYIYPRPGDTVEASQLPANVKLVDCPLLNISATFIRNLIKKEKSIQYLVPDVVHSMIKERKLYK